MFKISKKSRAESTAVVPGEQLRDGRTGIPTITVGVTFVLQS